MKMMKLYFIASGLLIALCTNAQKSPDNPNAASSGVSKWGIHAGIGIAAYHGDLMQSDANMFKQASYSFSAGASYAFLKKLSGRLDIGIHKVQAADSKNSGEQYKARNLSFKSSIFDVSLSAEYSILDLDHYMVTPYISAGVGMMFFNPYTNDAAGNKQYLRELGTEGQGLAAYPDRKMYKKSTVEFPLGLGLKYPITENIKLQLEFNYRVTGTDYLDDVSINGYPDKTLLDARNPVTARFTWRGNEVGQGAYPKNLALPRGNPNDKDGFVTTQLKVAYNF
jgi:opacity protein-like surface antigen